MRPSQRGQRNRQREHLASGEKPIGVIAKTAPILTSASQHYTPSQRSITDSLSPDLFGLIVSDHDTGNEVSSTFSKNTLGKVARSSNHLYLGMHDRERERSQTTKAERKKERKKERWTNSQKRHEDEEEVNWRVNSRNVNGKREKKGTKKEEKRKRRQNVRQRNA